ncbi:hypothetical protein HCU74_08345 [Spongiibacter sp. KMU-166]|uniref:Uncharacterized protein n=1 Tax=Spongiibacter thalassae TaxID=2721624 RepID=A0ABX1GE12_9GAMM|nr:hypothetical protein [Spongiibacter thalassae]NKI17425.1 hypothetical protein [Spongiibacter thalassae]
MKSLLRQVLSPLIKYLPSLVEAGKILIDKDTRKDNSGKASTSMAKIGIGASAVLAIDPATSPDTALITLLASLALYLYRRNVGQV